jgi:uncharacterized DUF497 family protein
MADGFRWNDWNREHATKHGCSVAEIESVVLNYPNRKVGDEKRQTVGRGTGGRLIQVVFVYSPGRTIYVIHATPVRR